MEVATMMIVTRNISISRIFCSVGIFLLFSLVMVHVYANIDDPSVTAAITDGSGESFDSFVSLFVNDMLPLAYADSESPTLSLANYDQQSGILILTFSEPIDATPKSDVVANKIRIRESGSSSGGVRLSAAELTTNTNSTTLSFTLTTANKNTVLGLNMPQIDINTRAVKDLSGNHNPRQNDIDITLVDNTKPTLSSASFDVDTKILQLTFSEDIDATPKSDVVATKIHIRESGSSSGGVTLSSEELTTSTNGTAISFTLTYANQQTMDTFFIPTIDIDAGAVKDLRGNANVADSDNSVAIIDNTKPTLSSATLFIDTKILDLYFSEPIDATPNSDVVANKIHIRSSGSSSGGVTLSAAEFSSFSVNRISFTLTDDHKNTVLGLTTPQLDIDAGAVKDLYGNLINEATDQSVTLVDNIKPTFTTSTFDVNKESLQ